MSRRLLVALPPVDPVDRLVISFRVSHDDLPIFLGSRLLSLLLRSEAADEEEEEEEDGDEAAADRRVENGRRVETTPRLRHHDDSAAGPRPISRATFERAGSADVAAAAREIARGAMRKSRSRRHVSSAG